MVDKKRKTCPECGSRAWNGERCGECTYFDIDFAAPDVIGYGDDMVEQWSTPVGHAADQLGFLIQQAAEIGYSIKWRSILLQVPELSHLGKRRSVPRIERIEELLEYIPDIGGDHLSWGGDSPGRSGFYYVFRVPVSQQDKVLKLLKAVKAGLDNLLENTNFEGKVKRQELKELRRQERLSKENTVREEASKQLEQHEAEKNEEFQRQKLLAEINAEVAQFKSFLVAPPESVKCRGMLLLTSDRWLYWIRELWAYRYLELSEQNSAVVEALRPELQGVVELREVRIPGTSLGHIPYFAGAMRPKYCGWFHNRTRLEVTSGDPPEDPNELRTRWLRFEPQAQV